MSLATMKPFSVSRNFFESVVTPIMTSGHLTDEAGLLDLLKKLHNSLWQKSGIPAAFSGAIAGYFQEVLDGYKFAVVKKIDVQLGAVGKVGGDSVVFQVGKTKTTQFKVTDVERLSSVEEHIAKAAWQLTGAGGESPAGGSKRVIEVIIQGRTLADTAADEWRKCIADAWDEGYVKQKPHKSKDELYAAVDAVKITTSSSRWKFPISQTPTGWTIGSGARKDPKLDHGYVFNMGRMHQHWLWLREWFKAEKGKYDIPATIQFGCGSGKPKTPDKLPFHTVEIKPLFSDDD
jgi:hypothetical protein